MAELEREIVVDATPETVFEYLTLPDKLVEWNGTEVEIDPRPGGVYRVLAGGTYQAAGEYVEVVPNEKVVYTFGWDEPGHPIPPGSTQVEISLAAEGRRPGSAWCTGACRTTPSPTTPGVGTTTWPAWPPPQGVGTPARTGRRGPTRTRAPGPPREPAVSCWGWSGWGPSCGGR